jgi:hypothetical protein
MLPVWDDMPIPHQLEEIENYETNPSKSIRFCELTFFACRHLSLFVGVKVGACGD